MSSVFISYSRRDKEFVQRLNSELVRRNKETWIDWTDIPPTTMWLQEIHAAIEGTDNSAFVISPHSVCSEMCRNEIAHAVGNQKRIIPILLHEVPQKNIPVPIGEIEWIDFTADNIERAVQSLIDAIETNPEWVRHHTRLLVRAREWENQNRDTSFLLRGMDLQDAVQWLARRKRSSGRNPRLSNWTTSRRAENGKLRRSNASTT